MTKTVASTSFAVLGLAVLVAGSPPAAAQAPSLDERVAALKQSQQQDQARLRQYEWIETTVMSLRGEEKSRKQNRCYFGADGRVQKLPVSATAAKKPRGLRGKIAENKKEELADYMERAAGTVKLYVPPDPGLLQRAKDAGKASIHVLEPGKRARLEFRDYLERGDLVGVEFALAANRVLGLSVSTFLGSPEDPVGLDVRFANLVDGTGYPARVTLDAKAKNVTVAVENTGYRKLP